MAANGPQQFYKVFLNRSPLKMGKEVQRTVKALGLRKTTGSVAHVPVNADTAGRILRIKELVKVALTDEASILREQKEAIERRERMKGWVKI